MNRLGTVTACLEVSARHNTASIGILVNASFMAIGFRQPSMMKGKPSPLGKGGGRSKNKVVHHVEVQQEIRAPVEVVFQQFSDHLSWNAWADQGRVSIEREGYPCKDGTACIKVTETTNGETVEEITSFDPPERLTYRCVRGGYWIMDHESEVLFDRNPETGYTIVTWRCRFNPIVPGLGWHFQNRISQDFAHVLLRLAQHVENPPLVTVGTEPCDIDGVSFELIAAPPRSICL